MKIPEISETTTWREQTCTVRDRSKHKTTGAVTLWLSVEGEKVLVPAPLSECGSNPAIKVGDRVVWESAPYPANGWNPFTVVAIDGGKALLDIYSKFVPVEALEKCV